MLIPLDYLQRKYDIKADGALHVGCHYAQEREAYTKAGIERVIWVDADETCLSEARRTCGANGVNLFLRGCVSDTDNMVATFHVATNEGQSSSILKPHLHLQSHPEVKFPTWCIKYTVRLDTLLDRYGVSLDGADWFLNIDIQGAELLALKGMGKLLRHFKYAYIEVNERELYKGCALFPEVQDYLRRFDFQLKEFKMTGEGWGDAFFMRLE